MNTRPPRCNYTRSGLEVWLERLTQDWEGRFSREEVEHGRELYRQGVIRDIGLDAGEAMVAGAWDELSAHVVFYWREDGLHWRGSLDRPLHINALAVAGLYAIEELLVDELPALPSDAPPPPAPVAVPPPAADAPVTPPPPPAAPVSPRRLAVVFTLRPDGLIFTTRWDEPGRARRAVFGVGAPDAAQLLPADRDAVLRLATAARKAGFVFDARAAQHRFEAAEALPRFVRDTLPVWRTRFALEGDEALACLAAGVRELELGAILSPRSHDREDDDAGDAHAAHGDGYFSMDWRVGLDGEWFERETVRTLISRGESVTIVPGRGLVRLTHRDAATVADWPQSAHGAFPPYLMLSLFRDKSLRLDADPALTAWREALLAPPASAGEAPAFLRPYQAAGASWLAAQAARGAHPLLADEMGLGKTVQVLALLLAVRPSAAPSLIVCPASVVPVWQGEIEKFFPGTPVAVMGKGRRFDENPAPRVWICSYTQLRRHKAPLESVKFGYAVLDEAQFIKNPEAKVTQACFAVRADHRIALSGTPVENRPGDLWALFRFLMPGLLGRRRGFEDGFAEDMRAAAERLRAQISPFVLRRTKREVAGELPAKVEAVLPCPLTDLQREEYRRLVSGGLEEFGVGAPPVPGASAINLLALLTRLRQVACDPALLPWRADAPPEQSGKLVVLADKLAEVVAGGGKAVVFSQFTSLLDRVSALLRKRFPETPVWSLTGESRDRAAPVASFQKAEGAAIILVSLKAGGTGVTLTAGDYVFLLDPWWNPAVEAQAVDRVHRIGRDRTVFVYRMTATDTIEERIERLKATKRELFDRVVGDIPDLSDWREHFPTLEALIALSGDADAPSGVRGMPD